MKYMPCSIVTKTLADQKVKTPKVSNFPSKIMTSACCDAWISDDNITAIDGESAIVISPHRTIKKVRIVKYENR